MINIEEKRTQSIRKRVFLAHLIKEHDWPAVQVSAKRSVSGRPETVTGEWPFWREKNYLGQSSWWNATRYLECLAGCDSHMALVTQVGLPRWKWLHPPHPPACVTLYPSSTKLPEPLSRVYHSGGCANARDTRQKSADGVQASGGGREAISEKAKIKNHKYKIPTMKAFLIS